MKNKNELIKLLIILLAIIVFFTILSRIFSSNSMTLAEYAALHPQAETDDISGSDSITEADSISGSDSLSASDNLSATDDISGSDIINGSDGDVQADPNRVTYTDGFFYEPLSEDLQTYITGTSYPSDPQNAIFYADLVYIHVKYYNFDQDVVDGELICNIGIAQDLVEIFYELYLAEYQLEKVKLIEEYDGDDTMSMADNNTSCFNYRSVEGTAHLSQHAYGLAVDINPLYNPYIQYSKDGTLKVSPIEGSFYADRTLVFPYKIDENDLCYKLFMEHGFTWGGNWNSSKDYQHFQKRLD